MRPWSLGSKKDKQIIILCKRGMDDSYEDSIANSVDGVREHPQRKQHLLSLTWWTNACPVEKVGTSGSEVAMELWKDFVWK